MSSDDADYSANTFDAGIPRDEATWSRGAESIGLDEPAMGPGDAGGAEFWERLPRPGWKRSLAIGSGAAAGIAGLLFARHLRAH